MWADECLLCGGREQLMARPVATWRRSGSTLETRIESVAVCGPCRSEMMRLDDARALATTPTSDAHRRFRTWDAAGATAVLAVGYALAAAAGWVGDWGLWVAVAFALAVMPVFFVVRGVLEAAEDSREARWAASPEGRAHAALEQRMRTAWRRWSDSLRARTGFSTTDREGDESRWALDDRALIDPATWSPAVEPSYVIRRAGDPRPQVRTLRAGA